jgi:anti-sigma B factor antagonist
MEQYPECTSLHLDGEIDVYVAPRLRQCVADVWARTSSPCLIIDLSKVTFCDAAGLGVLLFAQKIMRSSNRRLVLAGVTKPVARVLQASGAIGHFEIHESVEHALADLGGQD